MTDDILEDLTEARTRFEAARKALQPLLDGGIDREGELAPLGARLERMEAEVAMLEEMVVGQEVGVAAQSDLAFRAAMGRQAVPSLAGREAELAIRMAEFGIPAR